MQRRDLLTATAVGAAGLLTGSAAPAGDAETCNHEIDHEHLKTIGECAILCNKTAHHCLDMLKTEGDAEHRLMHAKAHEMTMDCHEFCVQAAMLMTRFSPMTKYAHQACADACRDCAAACDKGQDEVMKKCAEACRACEKVCRSHGSRKQA